MIKVPVQLVRELRAKLRDFPEWNYLEKNEESGNRQLARCLYEALEEFNLIAPILDTWTFVNVPKIAVRAILDLSVIRVLEEVMIWMARNEFQYQSGNTSVRLYDKWRNYQALLPRMEQKAQQQATSYKIKMNIDGAWGENLTEMYQVQWLDDPRLYISLEL